MFLNFFFLFLMNITPKWLTSGVLVYFSWLVKIWLELATCYKFLIYIPFKAIIMIVFWMVLLPLVAPIKNQQFWKWHFFKVFLMLLSLHLKYQIIFFKMCWPCYQELFWWSGYIICSTLTVSISWVCSLKFLRFNSEIKVLKTTIK